MNPVNTVSTNTPETILFDLLYSQLPLYFSESMQLDLVSSQKFWNLDMRPCLHDSTTHEIHSMASPSSLLGRQAHRNRLNEYVSRTQKFPSWNRSGLKPVIVWSSGSPETVPASNVISMLSSSYAKNSGPFYSRNR